MRRILTGTCECCGESKDTELVSDDWTTRLEWYELCHDCMSDE